MMPYTRINTNKNIKFRNTLYGLHVQRISPDITTHRHLMYVIGSSITCTLLIRSYN